MNKTLIVNLIILLVLPVLSSCSMRTFYPTIGAVVGGAGGGLSGGPLGAAAGAGTGAAIGQIAKGEGDVQAAKEETKEVIKAISEGDVKRMIEIQAGEQKGTFDKVIDGIYKVLWLLGIGAALWFILPIIWAKSHVKKAVAKHVEELNGKNTSDS